MNSFFKKNTKLESKVLPKDKLSEKETRFLYYASLIFLALMIIGGGIAQCTHHARLIKMGYYKEEPNLPPMEGYARYEIAGYKLKIPIRYLFRVYQMRGNRWIDDSEEQKVESGIFFDLFMPDLKTVDNEVLWFTPHQLARHQVSVMLSHDERTAYSPEDNIRNRAGRLVDNGVKYGLREFTDQVSGEKYYIQQSNKDSYYWMVCDGLCRVNVVYSQYPGIRLSYTFGTEYFSEWSRINDRLEGLLEEFLVSCPRIN